MAWSDSNVCRFRKRLHHRTPSATWYSWSASASALFIPGRLLTTVRRPRQMTMMYVHTKSALSWLVGGGADQNWRHWCMNDG